MPLRVPGKFSAAVRAGALLPADARLGTVSWAQWLARTGGPDEYPPD